MFNIIIIIIIIKAICNAQDPLKKATNALSGSLKMLVSIYNVSYKQQCLQLCFLVFPLLLYFYVQYIVSMVFEVRESI